MNQFKRLLALSILCLASFTQLEARAKFQTYVQRGGAVAVASLNGSTLKVQRSCAGATVNVYLTGTTTPATIYSNEAGTPLGFSLTADSTGSVEFWGDEASFDLFISGASCGTFRRTVGPTSGNPTSDIGCLNVKNAPYNATGDGVADDTAELQAAFDAGAAAHQCVSIPHGTYLISSELQLDGSPVVINGYPHDYATATAGSYIKATAAMRSVLAVLSPRHQINNLKLIGNENANYGVYMANAAITTFTNVWATTNLFDGFHNSASGNNNHITLNGCYSTLNGKTYASAGAYAAFTNGRQVAVAGTVSTTSGSATLTFTGAPDLTAYGIRKGDLIAIGTTKLTASYYLIESAAATTITLQANSENRPTATASGLDFAIGVGDGWSDRRNGNGGVAYINNFISFTNGGSGMHMDAAYGHLVQAGDMSYNNFAGINFGVLDNSGDVTGAHADNVYCEGTAMCYYLGGGAFIVDSPNGVVSDGVQLFAYGPTSLARTTFRFGDRTYSWNRGEYQNFILQLRNNGGVIEHRIIADVDTGGNTTTDDRVTGSSTTYAASPALSNVVGFTSGGGILASNTAIFLFNVQRTQASSSPFMVVVEQNTTGTDYGATTGTVTTDVNGTTRNWLSIRLRNPLTGAQVAWATALGTPGWTIAVRFSGYLR